MSGRFEPSKMKCRLVIGAFGLLLVGLLLGAAVLGFAGGGLGAGFSSSGGAVSSAPGVAGRTA